MLIWSKRGRLYHHFVFKKCGHFFKRFSTSKTHVKSTALFFYQNKKLNIKRDSAFFFLLLAITPRFCLILCWHLLLFECRLSGNIGCCPLWLPQDSASVHACAYLVQARTLEPSFCFWKVRSFFQTFFQPQKHFQNPPHFSFIKIKSWISKEIQLSCY